MGQPRESYSREIEIEKRKRKRKRKRTGEREKEKTNGTLGGNLEGNLRGEKGGKAKARTRRWHCAACIDVATLRKGGDDAEEKG